MSDVTTLAVLLRKDSSLVAEVEPGGLGEALGMIAGDRIMQVQGWRVRASVDIRRILDTVPGDGWLTVQVKRSGGYAILGPVKLEEPEPQRDGGPKPDAARGRAPNDVAPTQLRPAGLAASGQVLLVTSDSIPGFRITGVRGLVYSVRTPSPREISATTRMANAFEAAMDGLRDSAAQVGANAVIAVRVGECGADGTPLSPAESSDTILLTGTAVIAVAAPVAASLLSNEG